MNDPFGVYSVSKGLGYMSEPLDRGGRMVLLRQAAKARKKGQTRKAKSLIGTSRQNRASEQMGGAANAPFPRKGRMLP